MGFFGLGFRGFSLESWVVGFLGFGFRGFSLESWVVGFLGMVEFSDGAFSDMDMLSARTILAINSGHRGSASSGRGPIGSYGDMRSRSRSVQ